MSSKTIFIYSNQPVIRAGNNYFSKYRNFIDFLTCLSEINDVYRIVVPCKALPKHSTISGMYSIRFNKKPIEVFGYESEAMAPVISLINALRVQKIVISAAEKENVVFLGPGPNSFLVYLSFIVPRSVRYGFIIRGDTLKTVSTIYRGSWRYYASTALVRLFRKRIVYLLKTGRAVVFHIGEHLRKQYPGQSENVTAIYPLVNDAFIRKDKRPRIYEEGPLRFLFVGRLSREKNIYELVRSFEMLSGHEKQWKLTIVGSGPLDSELRDRALSLNNQVNFTGHIANEKELIMLYDTHDILCLPSLTEGMPRSVIEAFSRGMPVLATPVGSLPIYFSQEIKFLCGYSAERILEGLRWCDKHRQKMVKMGWAGRKKISRFLIPHNAVFLDRYIMSFIERIN